MTRPLPLICLLTLTSLTLPACEKSQARQDTPAQAVTSTSPPPAERGEAVKPSPRPGELTLDAKMKAGLGGACLKDMMCPGYLRCIEKACATPHAITGKVTEETPEIAITGQEGEQIARFFIEIVDDDEERRRGLMFRHTMKPNWGMLFVYPAGDRPLSFWMRNTYIPLDMVFVDSQGVVLGVVEDATPHTETPRGVGKPGRYVLELVAGAAKEHGIKAGQRISLIKPPRDDYNPL